MELEREWHRLGTGMPSGTGGWSALRGCPGPRPAAAAADTSEAAAGPEPAPDGGPDLELRAELSGAYTSNLYHVTRRHTDEFETRNGPGDRFAGMKGPEDFLVSPEVGAAVAWELDDKRELEVWLAGGYVAHVRNAIANYVQLETGVAIDLSRDDRLALEAELIPTRFKKNYPAQEVAGTKIYDRADYLDLALELAYERRFGKRWSAALAYGFETIGYEDPFSNRNVDEHSLTLIPSVEVGRFELGVGLRGALASTPHGEEFGVPVDRSHYDIAPIAVVGLNLPSRYAVELSGSYRFRSYTTDVEADDTYFDRDDRKLDLELEASKGFGKTWTVALELGWTSNDADRVDAQDEPDAVDYDEFVVGAAVEATLP